MAYKLTEVYLVALLEDFTLKISLDQNYLHDVYLCNRDTGEIFYDKLGFTYIELGKFVKEEIELDTDLEEKTMYDSSLKYKWDNKNVLDYAKIEAREEGKEEGRLEVAKDIAIQLMKEGLAVDFIAKTTKLSIEEIKKL